MIKIYYFESENRKDKLSPALNSAVNLAVEEDIMDRKGFTELQDAVLNNNIDKAEILIRNGANPNQGTRKEGWRPLHFASSVDMVDMLIHYGADADGTDFKGMKATSSYNDAPHRRVSIKRDINGKRVKDQFGMLYVGEKDNVMKARRRIKEYESDYTANIAPYEEF